MHEDGIYVEDVVGTKSRGREVYVFALPAATSTHRLHAIREQ